MPNQYSNPLFAQGKNPWVLLLSLIGITIGGALLIGQVLGFLAAMGLSGVSIEELHVIIRNPVAYPEQRTMMLTMNGIISVSAFIIAPLIFYYTMIKGNLIRDFIATPSNTVMTLLVTIILVFSFVIVNTIFIEWNAGINLPDSLAGFEQWAERSEDAAKVLTEYLTQFDTNGYFVLTIIFIAIVPGVGEELLFRGFLQNILRRIFNNDHMAVWVAAILFSAIHFQFYGFLPRMLLGALFGYLYLWSGNLLIPMVAHFTNNALSLAALYMFQKGYTNLDVESTEALPTMYILIFSALFVVTLLYFKNFLTNNKEHERLDHRV